MRDTTNHFLEIHGTRLHHARCAEGPPLLLLHGFTGCSGDWAHAGGEAFAREYELIMPDARGHGRSDWTAGEITHRKCAQDTLALLDRLGVSVCRAVGVSMGANVLLHMASAAPERFSALVLVSGTMRFPEQARRIMRALPAEPASDEWPLLRARHPQGDAQIRALWRAQRALAESRDDVCFSTAQLALIRARALIVYGDRDPLYPPTMALAMYESIANAQLWVVPGAGHAPVFLDHAAHFAAQSLRFLATSA